MPKFNFTIRDEAGRLKNVGYLDMQNNAERATLRFYGDIVSAQWQSDYYAEDKCPQDIADFFAQLDANTPVDIYFNSGGGDVFAGLAICNTLKRHIGVKTGYVDGLAASIASVILMACDVIVIGTGAQIMVHKPWTWSMGNANDFRDLAERLDRAEESALDWYMLHVAEGVTREDLQTAIDRETWLNGEEAAKIFTISIQEQAPVAACVSSFFGKYKNLPENLIVITDNAQAAPEKAAQPEPNEAELILNDLYLYGTVA